MPTNVEKGAKPAIFAPHQKQRPARVIDRLCVSRLRSLPGESNCAPASREKPPLLQRIEFDSISAARRTARLFDGSSDRSEVRFCQKIAESAWSTHKIHWYPSSVQALT